jgi:hypothetical protein
MGEIDGRCSWRIRACVRMEHQTRHDTCMEGSLDLSHSPDAYSNCVNRQSAE